MCFELRQCRKQHKTEMHAILTLLLICVIFIIANGIKLISIKNNKKKGGGMA